MSELAPPRRAIVDDLREPRLRDRLASRLAGEIVSGRMQPGQQFPSAEEIVNSYGVSRTVARETLQTLSMVGLVDVQHGKRTEVRPARDWDVLSPVVQEVLRRGEGDPGPLLRDLYEYRLHVEPPAVALMAARGSGEDLGGLSQLARRMEELAATGADVGVVMAADRDFHDLVARASGNIIVAAVSRDISEVLTTLWALSRMGAADIQAVADQHAAIADAVARRDGEGAAAAMREHLGFAASLDISHLEPGGTAWR
jgi:DNA-binding FadR family transcriptional regulator